MQEVRHIAVPIIALGVVIAILYFGRVFFITSLIARDHRVHPGTFRDPADAHSLPALAGQFRGVHGRAGASVLPDRAGRLLAALRPVRRTAEVRPAHRRHGGRRAAEDLRAWRSRPTSWWCPARQRLEEERRNARAGGGRGQEGDEGSPTALQQPPAVRGRFPRCASTRRARPSATTSMSRLGSFYQILLMASFMPFPGVFHAELARPHQPQLSAVLPRRRPRWSPRAACRASPTWCALSWWATSCWGCCWR